VPVPACTTPFPPALTHPVLQYDQLFAVDGNVRTNVGDASIQVDPQLKTILKTIIHKHIVGLYDFAAQIYIFVGH
jgi:hypothetical protein